MTRLASAEKHTKGELKRSSRLCLGFMCSCRGHQSLSCHFIGRSLLWSTCGINSFSDELPWLDLQEDVYDWGLFLLRPPPQLHARYTRPARAENQCGWGCMQLELPYQSVRLCVCARHGLAAEVTECKVRQEQGGLWWSSFQWASCSANDVTFPLEGGEVAVRKRQLDHFNTFRK